MSDSNDWLASIDLNAVKPAKGQRKKVKPHKRIVYGEPSRLAPAIPFWAKGAGPDQQRQVTEVVGEFVPTSEICSVQTIYDEVLELIRVVEASDTSSKARLLSLLHSAIARYEFKDANAVAAVEAAKENQELVTLVSKAVDRITLGD